jgi:hypothetical protein
LKRRFVFSLFILSWTSLLAQQPYKLSSPGDVITVGVLVPATFTGSYLYNHKKPFTEEQISKIDINNINRFDRSAVYHFSKSSDKASDYLMVATMVAPGFLMFDEKMRDDAGIKAVMYFENILLTAAEISFVKSLVTRARPYVYNPDVPMSLKKKSDATCSFFSGHTAMTAASSYYMASLCSEIYGPRYDWVWAAAAVPPLLTGFFRYKAGKHFFTDILVGFVVGSFNGFIVTRLHETAD